MYRAPVLLMCIAANLLTSNALLSQEPDTTYLATIKAPSDRQVFAPDDTININALILALDFDGMTADKPLALVSLIRPGRKDSFTIQQSGFARVTPLKDRPDRFTIKYELKANAPLNPGRYLIQIRCAHGRRVLATPSQFIEIKEPVKDDDSKKPN